LQPADASTLRQRCRRRPPRLFAFTALAGLWFGCVPGVATAQRLDAFVDVATDYVVHGVSRSQGDPVLQGKVGAYFDRGWATGITASSMNLNPGRGPNREFSAYVSNSQTLGRDWVLSGAVAHYFYSPQIPGLPYDYSEARLGLAWRDRIEGAVTVSPDYSVGTRLGVARERTSRNFELNLSQPVGRFMTITAGAGRFEIAGRPELGLRYWSASAVASGRRASFALTYTDSGSDARYMFSTRATGGRLIATLSLRLH
jgi:uncharacterized protein (TIGR02001 family)